MWIMDTDNRYGFGQQEDGTSTPSYVNTFQRGAEESVWDTVDQPDWDNLSKGESEPATSPCSTTAAAASPPSTSTPTRRTPTRA